MKKALKAAVLTLVFASAFVTVRTVQSTSKFFSLKELCSPSIESIAYGEGSTKCIQSMGHCDSGLYMYYKCILGNINSERCRRYSCKEC